jgi:hypothetical protein
MRSGLEVALRIGQRRDRQQGDGEQSADDGH